MIRRLLVSWSTHIQPINDDFVDSIGVCCHCCSNLAPVAQPDILPLVDQGGVSVQLVVQHDIEAIAGKKADDKNVAVQSGRLAIQVVTADALCGGWGVLHRHTDIGQCRGRLWWVGCTAQTHEHWSVQRPFVMGGVYCTDTQTLVSAEAVCGGWGVLHRHTDTG